MPKRRKQANGQGSISYCKGRKSPWWSRLPAQYDINGKEYRPTVGFFKSRKEAEKALANYKGIEDIVTFKEIYEEYKSSIEFQKFSQKNQQRYEKAFERFAPIHDKAINEIKYHELQRPVDTMEAEGYITKVNGKEVRKEYSKDHIRRLKIVASKIYDLAIKNQLVTQDLSSLIEVGGVGIQRKKEIFTKEEIKQLFESIPNNPHARFVLILIFTGMRPAELLNLKKDNLNFAENTITDFGIKTDEGKNRIMYIHPKIRPMLIELSLESRSGYLMEYEGKRQLNDNHFYNTFYYPALEAAGVDKKVPYSCRYTFATIAHYSGVKDKALQKLMGHTNFDITAKSYIQDVDEFVYEEFRKIQ